MADNSYEYKRQFSCLENKVRRPVWFVFPGLGGEWVGMAKALMPIELFSAKIDEYHDILIPYGIDLKDILLSEDKNTMATMTNKFCATTAIELALLEVVKSIGITADGIIGHSFGEISAAYADGCLTEEEALTITFKRGSITESEKNLPKGLMAVVGLSWQETIKLRTDGVEVVCNNGPQTVVVSGNQAFFN